MTQEWSRYSRAPTDGTYRCVTCGTEKTVTKGRRLGGCRGCHGYHVRWTLVPVLPSPQTVRPVGSARKQLDVYEAYGVTGTRRPVGSARTVSIMLNETSESTHRGPVFVEESE